MKYTCTLKSPRVLAATLITIGALTAETNATIVITPVNNVEFLVGVDHFELWSGNSGTALFFGNASNSTNLNTANRISLSDSRQYFQADASSPLLPGASFGSSRAYVFESFLSSGATKGINFSTYDLDQNGIADTLFMLDFGFDILDQADDIIMAYATETGLSTIDLFDARSALLVSIPEPSTALLLGLGTLSFAIFRRRR